MKTTIKNFFKEVMNPLKTKQIVLILFKIKFVDEENNVYIRTLGSLLKINKKEYSRLFNILASRLDLSDNEYKSTPVTELIINYLIVDENNTKISKTTSPQKEKLVSHKIKNISLPSTCNLKLWGQQLSSISNIIKIAKRRSKYIFEVEIINHLERSIKLMVGNETILSFKDILTDEKDLRTFTRYFEKSEFHYINGKVLSKVVYKNTFFLKRLELFVNRESRKIIPQINQNFITLDIETQVLDKTISPIMVDIYDGMSHSNYFISDFNNVDEMMNEYRIK